MVIDTCAYKTISDKFDNYLRILKLDLLGQPIGSVFFKYYNKVSPVLVMPWINVFK